VRLPGRGGTSPALREPEERAEGRRPPLQAGARTAVAPRLRAATVIQLGGG